MTKTNIVSPRLPRHLDICQVYSDQFRNTAANLDVQVWLLTTYAMRSELWHLSPINDEENEYRHIPFAQASRHMPSLL